MISIVFANKTPNVTARVLVKPRAVFGNVFGLRSDWPMFHRKIRALAHRPPVFTQVVTIGKKEKLERFHLI
jgi:hypothetical protein